MTTRTMSIERTVVISSNSFERVMANLEAQVGHPDMARLFRSVAAAATLGEVEAIVQDAVGSAGLMEMARFDVGEVLRKEASGRSRKIVRLLIGNPLTLKLMAMEVPDAASYAPVTVLIDERSDGVHLSYDRLTSCLAPYGNAGALRVARDLDARVEGLLVRAAAD